MKTPIQIRFSDVDMAHHVHHAVYLQWFELARIDLLNLVTPAEHDWRTEGLILARIEVDYRMPVHLNDVLEVECWCSTIGSKSFDVQYEILRTNGDELGICATARTVMVCFNYVENSTIVLPEKWRNTLDKLKK